MTDKLLITKSENPEVIEIIKNCTARRYNLSDIHVKRREDGKRYCLWCDKVKLTHGNRKYCSLTCSNSAFASMNPQQVTGRNFLLEKQENKCNNCSFDFKTIVKVACIVGRTPEVDHIIPIALGGQSLGFDNHQVLCYDCHKTKTKKDIKDITKARKEKG